MNSSVNKAIGGLIALFALSLSVNVFAKSYDYWFYTGYPDASTAFEWCDLWYYEWQDLDSIGIEKKPTVCIELDEDGDCSKYSCVGYDYVPRPTRGGSIEQVGESNNGKPDCKAGNPINIATGNKFQEVSLISDSQNTPLKFSFFYNSLVSGYHTSSWQHSYERRIKADITEEMFNENPSYWGLVVSNRAYIIRDDGKVLKSRNSYLKQEGRMDREEYLMGAGTGYRLLDRRDEDTYQTSGYRLITPAGVIEDYGLDGRLELVNHPDGRTETPIYAEGKLIQVTDSRGYSLSLDWSVPNEVTVADRDGVAYRAVFQGGYLAEVVFPDQTLGDDSDNYRNRFLYENGHYPHQLSGIEDADGTRIATWGYSGELATSSSHAGGVDDFELRFNADGTITVLDPGDTPRTYTFININGIKKVKSVAGGDCSSCSSDVAEYTYDERGYVASKTDFNGNRTNYVRDSNGRELSRTEAVGTSDERRIETTWHPTFNKPTEIREPGRTTILTYNARGLLESRVAQSQP